MVNREGSTVQGSNYLNAAIDDEVYQAVSKAAGRSLRETEHTHRDWRRPWSRYKTVLSELRKLAGPDVTLLDVGCCDGVYTIPWRKMGGGPAVGLDIAEGFLEQATILQKQEGIDGVKFVVGDIQDESINIGGFDVVLMSEVLEHLNHPNAAMRNVRKHVKERGSLILTVPTPACQIMPALGFRLRYIRGLLARRVREELILCTDDIPYIRNAGLGGYLFRHDAYWPHTLPRWVESFGFQCKRHYTIGWLGQQMIGIDSRLASIGYPDLVFRHMKVMNLFGMTNVGLFVAT